MATGIGSISFLVLVSYLCFIIYKTKFELQNIFKLISIVICLLFPILFFSLTSSGNLTLMSVYLFPLIVTQALLIPLLSTRRFERNEFQNFLMTLVFLGSVGVNFFQNLATETNGKYAINTYLLEAKSTLRLSQVEAQLKLSSHISDQRPLTIVQSYRSPNLRSELRREVDTFFSFDNWGQFLDLESIDYILVSQNDIALLNTKEQESQITVQKSRAKELRLGIDLISQLFSENKFGDHKCKQIALEQGNTLFACH